MTPTFVPVHHAGPRLHITGSRHARPAFGRVAYCDGSLDEHFREGVDLELSHWMPNRTPAALKADTSTGIALNFVAQPAAPAVDGVINNHADTDGVLSTFAVCHPALALAHRDTLVQAATMGDFLGWGEADAQHLFQVLALQRRTLEAAKTDPLELYRALHGLVVRVLQGERVADTAPGLAALQRAVRHLDDGRIERRLLATRLVHYRIPALLADGVDERIGWLPAHDEPVHPQAVLPPAVRARTDAQRLQLLSVQRGDGWTHDLCVPGYTWAETVTLWRVPGLRHDARTNRYRFEHPPLAAAAARLNDGERGAGRWTVAERLDPFTSLPGRRFPVVLACLRGEEVATSRLHPDAVADVLAAVALDADGQARPA